MPNVTILPPQIGSGRIYFGDVEGEQDLQPVQVRGPEQRQADADATEAYFRRVAALQAERQAESERGKLPFEDMPGVYRPVWRGNELAMEIDPNAMAAAQQAVEAATQFQGIRGYQKALEEGKNPSQAMAEFAPLIFAKKYPSSLAAQAAAASRVHNIGGVGYMQDPNNPTALVPVTPPREAAAIEERDIAGGKVLIARQPSGAVTFKSVTAPADQRANDLQRQAMKAQDEFEQARTGLAKARAVGVEDGKEIPPDAVKVAQAEAVLNSAGNRLSQSRKALDSYLASKRGPVTAPAAQPQAVQPPAAQAPAAKALSKDAIREAYRQAGGDRAKARQLLIDAGYTL